MTRMKFEMWRNDDSDKGIYCSFENKNTYSSTYFNNPPSSIDHVCINYLKERFWNVKRREQEEFIKKRFKEEIGKFL